MSTGKNHPSRCFLFDPRTLYFTGARPIGSCRPAAANCHFPAGPFATRPTTQPPPHCCYCCCCCFGPPTAVCANISEAAEQPSPAATRSDHPVASQCSPPSASAGQQQLGMGAVPLLQPLHLKVPPVGLTARLFVANLWGLLHLVVMPQVSLMPPFVLWKPSWGRQLRLCLMSWEFCCLITPAALGLH